MNKYLPRGARKYIYGVSIAAVPVLVYFGLIDIEASALILPLVLAILNLSDDDLVTEEPEDYEEYQGQHEADLDDETLF